MNPKNLYPPTNATGTTGKQDVFGVVFLLYLMNPCWQEVHQLAIYKCSREIEVGATEKQLQLAVCVGRERGSTSRL